MPKPDAELEDALAERTEAGPETALRGPRLAERLGGYAALIALLLALPIGIVVLAVRYGGGTPPAELAGPFQNQPIGLAALFLALAFLVYRSILGIERLLPFTVAATAAGLSFTGLSVGLGVAIHRDFFTAAFQHILGLPVLFLYHLWTRAHGNLRKETLRILGGTGLVISILFAEWIMLMGYAIATRSEPRPVESLIYNVYNLGLAFILFLSSRGVEQRSYRTVVIEADSLTVDGRDIAPVLGRKKAAILRAFASAPGRTLRCPDIQKLLRDPGTSGKAELDGPSCETCGEQSVKAALCSRYRSTYNTLLEMKKLLELLEIGTITAPGNKRHILTEGWKLSLFENVRILGVKKNA